MTKRQQIVALLKEGLKYIEIAERTGSSYKYVANIAMDLKRPGCLNVSGSKYRKKNLEKYSRRHREWNKNNQEKRSENRKMVIDFHQQKTLAVAHNKCQRWTTRELEYLEKCGKEKTIHQLALYLGRTYMAVQMSAIRHGIDLRGDKIGAGAAKFVGSYRD